jgi:7,8-dihydro-6-hydroxymethylpterin-pyrophosphokinase
LRSAVTALPHAVAELRMVEKDPIGGPGGRAALLNMVGEVDTLLDPFALLRRCQRLEVEAMRQRVAHWTSHEQGVVIIASEHCPTVWDDFFEPAGGHRRFLIVDL